MRALIATIAAGLLYGLLFPPFALSWLSWLALAPLAGALRGRSFAAGAGLAFLFAAVGTASVVPWLVPTLREHFSQGWATSVAFWLLVSLTALAPYYAVLLGAGAWAARRLPAALAPVLFACAWTGAEWCRVQLGLRSPWARLGDAHAASVHLRQVADVFGVYGLGFLLALCNAVVAEAAVFATRLARRCPVSPAPLLGNAVASVVLVALALGYGVARRSDLAPRDSTFEVALVQGNLEPELRWRRSRASHVLHRYGGLTRDLLLASDSRPDLVVWPENAVQTPVDDPVYGPPLRRLSAGAPLLLGAPRSESVGGRRRSFNSVFLLEGGDALGHYDKRRLLPFGETRPLGWAAFGGRGDLDSGQYTPGDGAPLFAVGGEHLAPLVCMEALYPSLAREAVLEGATALANLSNDGWFRGRGGAEQHLAMVIFRAVETRRPLLRATGTGISAVIAPDGSTVARLDSGVKGVLRARVPRPHEGLSLYARVGDVFAAACAAAVALAVLAAAIRGEPPTRPLPPVRRGLSRRST